MSTIGNENDYIDNYLKELSTRSVRYGQDYLARSLPSPLRIKRKPTHKQPEPAKEDSNKTVIKDEKPATDSFELLVKILKPASQFRITRLQLDDTILNLKQRIYQQQTIPVKQQRLLLKGKVLNDEKALGDYQMTKDTTLHLMVSKPTGASAAASSTPPSPQTEKASGTAAPGHELSSEAQSVVKSDAFWNVLEQTLDGQLNSTDAKLVLETWKKALSG
ncbi:ubiquitin-related domain-containing protein [Absidia repens]|uniref:Ubiquitin-related domain-containing protein n=1 Tax=Absidia repens TaxID=90262 RepID=A0A1X2IPD9_9FUNG|nr:ubiquitin-related domain-containing protein [Absidia repens]